MNQKTTGYLGLLLAIVGIVVAWAAWQYPVAPPVGPAPTFGVTREPDIISKPPLVSPSDYGSVTVSPPPVSVSLPQPPSPRLDSLSKNGEFLKTRPEKTEDDARAARAEAAKAQRETTNVPGSTLGSNKTSHMFVGYWNIINPTDNRSSSNNGWILALNKDGLPQILLIGDESAPPTASPYTGARSKWFYDEGVLRIDFDQHPTKDQNIGNIIYYVSGTWRDVTWTSDTSFVASQNGKRLKFEKKY
jgi:hypothetical protein